MGLILLPDQCTIPNMATKRKRKADPVTELVVAEMSTHPHASGIVSKSPSFASISSAASSFSKASARSETSSKCSFAPIVNKDAERNCRVRIAVGGCVD